ncbi:MAG: MBL fold metallo-hydrolase [Verrucomicrobiales bacterium]|nr:MBL fold metallo-hydrolase [Verrucomicrobiales bacterium]
MSDERLSSIREKGVLTFWGVRGSIPTPGKNTVVHGGNTSCVSVEYGDHIIILDAGTGIRKLGSEILSRSKDLTPKKGHIFITHYHWDHIQGLPFFSPAFDPGKRFRICGEPRESMSLQRILEGQMHVPFFPVEMDSVFAADIDFTPLACDETFFIDPDIPIHLTPFRAFHPNLALGFRLNVNGCRICYLPDNELDKSIDQSRIFDAIYEADILIHDAQFTRETVANCKRGWGHSAFEDVAELAREAKCKKLFLFHHDPDAKDSILEERQLIAQEIFPNTTTAHEGLFVRLFEGNGSPST